MARDAGHVLAGAVHQKIRHLKETEQISVGGARSLGPWRAIGQILPHEPLQRAWNVTTDLAQADRYQRIDVDLTAATLTKLGNGDVARQGESTERIPVIHPPKRFLPGRASRAIGLRLWSILRVLRTASTGRQTILDLA